MKDSQLDAPAASSPASDNRASPAEVVLSDVHVGRCSPGCTWWTSSFSRIDDDETTGATASASPTSPGRDGDRDKGSESASKGQENVQGLLDEDGDLVLPRKIRRKLIPRPQPVVIKHFGATTISGVGLQVWRGSLLLADFAMSSALGRRVQGKLCLELGSGTGITGILLARCGADVFITDTGDDVLQNCADNVDENKDLGEGGGLVWVRELDWGSPQQATGASDGADGSAASSAALQGHHHQTKGSSSPFCWSVPDRQRLQQLEYVFAGDTIYDDALTDSFIECARHLLLLPRRPVMFLAMEKRWNFTLEDMDTCAPAFDHLMRRLGVNAFSSLLSRGAAASVAVPSAAAVARNCDEERDRHGDDHVARDDGRNDDDDVGYCAAAAAAAAHGDDDGDDDDDDDDSEGDGVIWQAAVCLGSLDPSSPLHVAGSTEVLEIGRMDVARIPQTLEYERGPDLEMWRFRILSSVAA